jgi:hypothetical protein
MGFKRWLRNWLYSDQEQELKKISSTAIVSYSDSRQDFGNSIKFNLVSARGGAIITVKHYDQVKDRNFETVYVIHEDDNFDQNLLNIINMERIKL